jgi:hypothetical protein
MTHVRHTIPHLPRTLLIAATILLALAGIYTFARGAVQAHTQTAARAPVQAHTQNAAASCFSQLPSQIDCSWRFIFDDEFSGATVNTKLWGEGWIPGASRQLATFESANCVETGGFLHQEALEPSPGVYTSCAMYSLMTQKYGFFQWRGYMPANAGGTTASYWLFSASNGPEVDTEETHGSDPTNTISTYHWDYRDYITDNNTGSDRSASETTYSVRWTPMDLWVYASFQALPLIHLHGSTIAAVPMHIMINLLVGGSFSGPVTGTFPITSFRTQWVRAWSMPAGSPGSTMNPVIPYPFP